MTTAIEQAKQNISLEKYENRQAGALEIGASAAAQAKRAMIESRLAIAYRFPRNMEAVRQKLITECSRADFALETREGEGNRALYRKPVGKTKIGNEWVQQYVEGLGIGFTEVAVRCMGNLMVDSLVEHDSPTEMIMYVYAFDLESNTSFGHNIRIPKTVERKFTRDGDVIISTRMGEDEKPLHTVIANESALANTIGANVSKGIRNQILRLIPGDFQQACIDTIKSVRERKISEDPDAYIRRVIDGMYGLNVTVEMLEEYLGHPIKASSPAEIANLQAVYATIKDRETTWAEIAADTEKAKKMQPKPKVAQETNQEPQETAKSDKGVEAAKEKIREEKANEPEKKTEPEKAKEEPAKEEPKTAPVEPEVQEVKTEPVKEADPDVTAQTAVDEAPPWAIEEDEVKEVPMPERLIRGIQFPNRLEQLPDGSDAPTSEQLEKATERMAFINSKLGTKMTIEKNIQQIVGIPANAINSKAMECFQQFLDNVDIEEQLRKKAAKESAKNGSE